MQAAKRDCNAHPTRDLYIWLCGRQTDLGVHIPVTNLRCVQDYEI